MNSKQEEFLKSTTPCKDCAFSEYKDDVQTGCSAGRIEKFKELGQVLGTRTSDGKTYDVVSRFCNYFRTSKWHELNPENPLEIVRDQSAITFGIAVNCENHNEEKIGKTISCLENIDYDPEKITIVLSVDDPKNITHLVHGVNVLKRKFHRVFLVKNNQDITQIKDFDVFSKCANRSYFTTLEVGGTFSPNLFSGINKLINEDLLKLVFIESSDTQTLSSEVVKRQYLNYRDYNLMMSEIKEQSKHSDMYAYYEEKH